MTYKHTQPGTWLLIFFAIAASLIIFSQGGITVNSSWIALVILVPASVIFSSQTIKIDQGSLIWHFGFGFWKKQLALTDIVSAEAVRNKWYYGLGIRYTPRGWLYAVSGLDAVEIQKQDGSVVRLGTNEPETLQAAIQQHIAQRSEPQII